MGSCSHGSKPAVVVFVFVLCLVAMLFPPVCDLPGSHLMDCTGQAPLSVGFSRQECWSWIHSSNTLQEYISFSSGTFWPRDRTHVSCIGRWVIYHWATWEAPYWFLNDPFIFAHQSDWDLRCLKHLLLQSLKIPFLLFLIS